MSQQLAELCCILVENAFGDLAAKVFSTLAHLGRLSFISLRDLSGISGHRLKVGLATLIQHHLVLYHAEDEDSPTFFQVDWTVAYSLIRSRKLLTLIEDREGETAGQVVASILQLGHVSVGDLTDEYDPAGPSKRNSGVETVDEHAQEDDLVNGVAEDDKQFSAQELTIPATQLHSILRRLLADGILVKVTERTYLPYADLKEQIKETVIAEKFPDRKITGSKKSKDFQFEINTLKRKFQEDDAYSDTRDIVAYGEIKRPSEATSSKKRIKTNDTSNGINHHHTEEVPTAGDHGIKLPNDMVVRINFDKCTILLRNERFIRTASQYLGPVTAGVYAALLKALEAQDPPVRDALKVVNADEEDEQENAKTRDDDEDSDDGSDYSVDDYDDSQPHVTDAEVDAQLDKSLDLSAGLKRAPLSPTLTNGTGEHHKKARYEPDDRDDLAELGIKQEPDSDADDDDDDDDPVNDGIRALKERQKRLELIDVHLGILAEHPHHFCRRATKSSATGGGGGGGGSKSSVNFSAIAQTLIRAELDAMVLARFGKLSLRMVRVIRERQKLDDKPLAAMTLQKVQDSQALLTALQFHGLLESQELPKDNGRQPSRTLYLWWFDEERVTDRSVECMYQGMVRCLQRLRVERQGRFRAAIDKAERIGMADDGNSEEEDLNGSDKDALRKWREVEEALLVQIERLDDLVVVLRDSDGKDTSLTS